MYTNGDVYVVHPLISATRETVYIHYTYIDIYISYTCPLGRGPQGPRGAHKGPAHKGPGGPTRAQGARKGPAHKGPGGRTRTQPARAQ